MDDIIKMLSGLTLIVCATFIAKSYNNVRNFCIDLFHVIVGFVGWGKRTSVRGDIELIANKSIDQLNRISPELQLPDMSIEWVKQDSDGNVRFDKNKAIVMLKYDDDRVQNVINSTSAYIHNSLLMSTRSYMDESVIKAVDFQVIRKFLQNTPQRRFALSRYMNENLSDITQYNDTFNKVSTTDDAGLLTHILLREYTLWGDCVATDIPTPDHHRESREVLDFVYEIATREYDDPTPLQYNHKDIKLAVLLVAKTETYESQGCRPYVRRIREGFANGIKTFYLLARGEKIEILSKVYGELIQTGNFNCDSKPQTYKDREGRECVCYCLTVDKEGDMAQDYSAINDAIQSNKEIELVVEHVYRDELKCLFNNNLQVIVPVCEITDKEIKLWNFYTTGMSITAIPISVSEGGVVIASLKETQSNPQYMIDNQYAVGNIVTAVVQEADDEFVKFLVDGTDMEAIAFRRDLTFSRYLFLHNLFPVGSKLQCNIIDIDYVYNRLRLSNSNLNDPWSKIKIKKGDVISVTVYEITDTYIGSEIDEGVKIVLPFSELAWCEYEIKTKKDSIKRNQTINCTVIDVDDSKRIVIVSQKTLCSPSRVLYDSLESDKIINAKLDSQNSSGILAYANNSQKVFIPLSETHISDNRYPYSLGQCYDVKIIGIAQDERSLIGSFKPFIQHPLDIFSKDFSVGDEIPSFEIYNVSDKVAFIRLRDKKYRQIRIRLFASEVSSLGFISEMKPLRDILSIAPLVVKRINYDKNCVDVSLKETLQANNDKRNELDYDSTYSAVVISYDCSKFYVIIPGRWIEGSMDISSLHKVGESVNVRLAAHGSEYADFIED